MTARWAALLLTVAAATSAGTARAADEVLTPADASLGELSGLATDPAGAGYWVHQDAGAPSDLTLIAGDGTTAGRVLPLDAGWQDPEDLGVGPFGPRPRGGLYVADTGDAAAVRSTMRTRFRVARGELPVLAPGEARVEPFESLRFRYPDGGNRNVEALLVDPDTGDCWLVTKTVDRRAELWFLPESAFGAAPVTAAARGRVARTGVSGGAVDPAGRFVVLRDGQSAYLYRVARGGIAAALRRRPTRVPLPAQPQGEGITVSRDGAALVSNSEGAHQPFWRIPLPRQFVRSLPAAAAQEVTPAPATPTRWPLAAGALIGALGVAVLTFGRRRTSL